MVEPVIAYFISPHGYGHAARSAAVMEWLRRAKPGVRFEIFTRVPRWFFEDSLAEGFNYHSLLTDIGLAQKNSLVEDLSLTVSRLADFLPFDAVQVGELAGQIKQSNCQLVICDISPLGIAVARAAGLPAILVENFTWDWIYEGYLPLEPRLAGYIAYLQSWFAAADYRIQTEPVCHPQPAALTVAPVSRTCRTPAAVIRQKLEMPAKAKVVLLTMGGIPWDFNTFLEQLAGQPQVNFILPGGSQSPERRGNLTLLPHHSVFYHPDLVHAADVVIGKLGYSTLAEVYHAGRPFGYVPRSQFRESLVLSAYAEQCPNSLSITADQFESGGWLSLLPDLLAFPRIARDEANGAAQAAQIIAKLLP